MRSTSSLQHRFMAPGVRPEEPGLARLLLARLVATEHREAEQVIQSAAIHATDDDLAAVQHLVQASG